MKVTDKARAGCSACQNGEPEACIHWFIDNHPKPDPPAPSRREMVDMAWTIVKDGRGMKDEGHYHAYEWARNFLGLEDRPTVRRTRHPHGEPPIDS